MPSFDKAAYREYRCLHNAPLSCNQPVQTVQQVPGAKFCLECGFPTVLPDKAELKGSRGTYQVVSYLGHRGMGRLYSGIQVNDNQPVVIKEYLLPKRCFNAEETRQRQETFMRVAGVSLADGRNQDFRLVSPWEAIADQQGERCYLITLGNLEASLTLSRYLMEKGAMTPSQVREVLNQTLQTLQFLHSQKLRLPSGQVRQGLAYGNMSLDSLLIVENRQQFYIYLCDLAAWERLFDPPTFPPSNPKPEQDLVALGQVGFHLLHIPPLAHVSSRQLDPREEQPWTNADPPLKQFLYHLVGLDTPFASAEAARQALLQLPIVDQPNLSDSAFPLEQKKRKFSWSLTLMIGALALLLVGGGIWYYLSLCCKVPRPDPYAECNALPASFSDVNGVPPGDFKYTAEAEGSWNSFLYSKPESDEILKELLTKPKPNVNTQFSYTALPSDNIQAASKPIEAVREGNYDFAITSLRSNYYNDLDSQQIGYDGLLVFVAFSKDQKLPKALHGQISLEQLRQLYTKQITNWQLLDGPDLPVELYVPTDPEAVRWFEQRVFQDDPQQIASFKANITQLDTLETERKIVTKYDKGEAGIISFGFLSKTLNQCQIYPLALVDGNKPASQAVVLLNGNPIDPNIDLCNTNKRLDVKSFQQQSYPLGYPLNVVYARDNRRSLPGQKFAELLRTCKGQRLLQKAGLVPLQPTSDN